jgi:hypothetical protein
MQKCCTKHGGHTEPCRAPVAFFLKKYRTMQDIHMHRIFVLEDDGRVLAEYQFPWPSSGGAP